MELIGIKRPPSTASAVSHPLEHTVLIFSLRRGSDTSSHPDTHTHTHMRKKESSYGYAQRWSFALCNSIYFNYSRRLNLSFKFNWFSCHHGNTEPQQQSPTHTCAKDREKVKIHMHVVDILEWQNATLPFPLKHTHTVTLGCSAAPFAFI